jgi:hypothetical protein
MNQIWKSFDDRLFVLKFTEPVRRMHEETASRHRKIQFEHSRSGQGPHSLYMKLIDCDLAILREHLEVVDRLCREVWQTQGNTITAAFVRAMRDNAIWNTIGGRTGAIRGGIENMAKRTGYAQLNPIRHYLAQEVDRLKLTVANRYEAEARELEYKNVKSSDIAAVANTRVAQGTPIVTMPEADMWRNFRDEFRSLASEERIILQRTREDRGLRVHCEYNSDRSIAEDNLCRDRLFCLLYRLETGRWDVTEGPNRDFKARFEALATRAGLELGPPTGTLPVDFWLHSLSLHLRRSNSNDLFARCDTGGIITNACQSSATFCSLLEKRTLEGLVSATGLETMEGRMAFSQPNIRTKTLQNGLKEIEMKLNSLKERFPLWVHHLRPSRTILPQPFGYLKPQPPAHCIEIWRLEDVRERIILELSKRGKLPIHTDAETDLLDKGRGTTDQLDAHPATEEFSHSVDYRSVCLGGKRFTLTSRQAQVIQLLHGAHEKATPEIGAQYILEEIGSPNSRLRDSFKSNQEAWKALVRPGKKKGTIRLNV